jgi:hypothetical protein
MMTGSLTKYFNLALCGETLSLPPGTMTSTLSQERNNTLSVLPRVLTEYACGMGAFS